MSISDHILSAFAQVAVAFGLGSLIYGICRAFFPQRLTTKSLLGFIGLVSAREQLDKVFWLICLGTVAFAVVSTTLEFYLSDSFRQVLTSDSSPYGKILKSGFDLNAVFKGFIYAAVQSSLAEEILFRGLLARRLFNIAGKQIGNVVQALIFWLMHLFIFRLVAGEWISHLQLVVFCVSFSFGLLFGYANFRRKGQSIAPSWILHATGNFTSFLTMAALWPK